MSEIYVQISATKGSAPRDAGTAMKVTMQTTEGTIGGGALEHKAITHARKILAENGKEQTQTIPLGPGLGQCCGGSVTLRYTRETQVLDISPLPQHLTRSHPANPLHLWLWGAGHVGRAFVKAAQPQAFHITWIDDAERRFPAAVPKQIKTIPAADMPLLASRAPTYAHHLIFTYSHDIDLKLCAALLKRGAASIGLIGSDTKWTRFSKRLREMGLDPAPIICPIGDKSLGKQPYQIASGTISALLQMTPQKVSA